MCKCDSTRVHNGPLGHRVIRLHYPEHTQTVGGWCAPHQVQPALGAEYDVHVACSTEPDELETYFRANEERIKGDFKCKIATLQKFLRELNERYELSYTTNADLHRKVAALQTQA